MKQIKDFRGYFMMPWDVAVDCTKSEILIFGYLFNMSNGTQEIELSYSQIMEAVGISKRNIVSNAISKFESKGYISVERGGQTRNRIRFNNVVEVANDHKGVVANDHKGTNNSNQKGTIGSNQKGTIGSNQKVTHIKEQDIEEQVYIKKDYVEKSTDSKEPKEGVDVFNLVVGDTNKGGVANNTNNKYNINESPFNKETKEIGDCDKEVSKSNEAEKKFLCSKEVITIMAEKASKYVMGCRYEKVPSIEDITGDLSWMDNKRAKEYRLHDASIIRQRLMRQIG